MLRIRLMHLIISNRVVIHFPERSSIHDISLAVLYRNLLFKLLGQGDLEVILPRGRIRNHGSKGQRCT